MATARNRLSDDLAYVNYMLEEWAKWSRAGESIGYPAVTQLGRFIHQGIHGAAQVAFVSDSRMPPHVESVEKKIIELDPYDRAVLVMEYAPNGGQRGPGIGGWRCRKQMGISLRTYHRRLHRARKTLALALDV